MEDGGRSLTTKDMKYTKGKKQLKNGRGRVARYESSGDLTAPRCKTLGSLYLVLLKTR